MILDDPFQRTV